MEPEVPEHSYQAALRRIVASANAIKEAPALASSPSRVTRVDNIHGAWDDIHPSFLPADDATDVLIKDGVVPPVACKAGEAIQRYLKNLQTELQTSFTTTWTEIVHRPRSSKMPSLIYLRSRMCTAYESIYNRKKAVCIENARRLASAKLSLLRSTQSGKQDPKEISQSARTERPTFNPAYVSILEACFAKNAAPSRTDKMLLAEKMGMSYKQIHVWFQNRRSRTRKTSNTLSSGRTAGHSSETSCSPSVTLPKSNESVHDSFAIDSPAFAFPVRYPPEVDVDPFPSRFGDFSCLRNLDWPRRPTKMSQKACEPDVEALCVAFASLRIANANHPVSQKGNKRVRKGRESLAKSADSHAYPPFVVRPLHAPLFSLLCNVTSRASGHSGQRLGDKKELSKVVATPCDANGLQSTTRNSRTRKCGRKELSSAANGPVSVNRQARKAGPANTQARIKRSEKHSASQRTTRKPTSERSKGKEVSAQPAVQLPEPPSSRPSPTPSIESLPSLSYSSGGSSSSTYSQSPTPSFLMLSDDGHSPPHDPYQSTDYSLTLPTPQTAYDEYPSTAFAFDGFSFDLPKGPSDHSLDFGLPEYPSYSDTLDSLSQGLQSSSDLAPLLSFELPPLAS